jgi:protein-L-isoaspartate(D-aspartate) O-methyltransferase
MRDWAKRRADMVMHQIRERGIRAEPVLDAIESVPREAFLEKGLQEFAYDDSALPIGESQTMSQPYIVALMAEAAHLKKTGTVLEIGTGTGYAAAVLAKIASQVYTVERIASLAAKADAILKTLGYRNIHILHADGTQGWRDHAPYDAILVAASGPKVPETLKQQLKIGGRLIMPVGTGFCAQELVRVTRLSEDSYRSETIADVLFVPLVGQDGWPQEAWSNGAGGYTT